MTPRTAAPLLLFFGFLAGPDLLQAQPPPPRVAELTLGELGDRIEGGLLGQILGNLNGLPHENQYIESPGEVADYRPGLPEGARTDDDTDIEWCYLLEIERTGAAVVPPPRIVELWKAHINDHIWSANRYARQLMELGLEPPFTGQPLLNPWSDFNLAGQFTTESFGLCSPALPRAAARLAVHHAGVAVEGEPLQAGQFLNAMIARAFIEADLDRLIEEGLEAVDSSSEVAEIIRYVREQQRLRPGDWKAVRQGIRDRYTLEPGIRLDANAYALNTAAVVAALLYGKGEFVDTLQLAFNFGWDADCNAATCGTILGVIKGRRWMDRQGWTIVDRYKNTTRPGLPEDETISRFAKRIQSIALRQVIAAGGSIVGDGPSAVVRIPVEAPEPVRWLKDQARTESELKKRLASRLENDLAADDPMWSARAAYLALCTGDAPALKASDPEAWRRGVTALQQLAPGLLEALKEAPGSRGRELRSRAEAVGLGLGGQ